jgi:glutathione S-transferase
VDVNANGDVPRLYHRWKCPWCAAVRQAIENVGAEVELVEVPYPREERAVVMTTSGQRRVPVLVDDGEIVVDSRAIVRHLYAKYGGPFFARSIAELDKDIAADGDFSSDVAEYCELPSNAQ